MHWRSNNKENGLQPYDAECEEKGQTVGTVVTTRRTDGKRGVAAVRCRMRGRRHGCEMCPRATTPLMLCNGFVARKKNIPLLWHHIYHRFRIFRKKRRQMQVICSRFDTWWCDGLLWCTSTTTKQFWFFFALWVRCDMVKNQTGSKKKNKILSWICTTHQISSLLAYSVYLLTPASIINSRVSAIDYNMIDTGWRTCYATKHNINQS